MIICAALRPVAALVCVGDCQGNGRVGIADLVLGVNIALGSRPVSDCEAFADDGGAVEIAQLIQGVNNALNGCSGVRFVDNGDGTIADTQTGLTWEKKVGVGAGEDYGNLHGADNTYLWAGECTIGDLCQPNEAAAAACMQGAQSDKRACGTCQGELGLPSECITGSYATIWDWVAQLNAGNFAGHADWRIPSVVELESILDYTVKDPAVNAAFNGNQCGATCTDATRGACSCTQSCSTSPYPTYWSASNGLPFQEWYVDFCDGGVDYFPPAGSNFPDRYVRAVRGGFAMPTPRFVDNGDGTITDRQTGLIWEKKVALGGGPDAGNLHDADNTYMWSGECSLASDVLCQPNTAAAAACAQAAQPGQTVCDPACEGSTGRTCDVDPCVTCRPEQGTCIADPFGNGQPLATIWEWVTQLNAANFAGHADWRVPTEVELLTIVDYAAHVPALDSTFGAPCTERFFPGSCAWYWLGTAWYWSVTPQAECPSFAWLVTFDWGTVYGKDKLTANPVRAVRGGA